MFMYRSWNETFDLTKCIDEVSYVAFSSMASAMEMSFKADMEWEEKTKCMGTAALCQLHTFWAGLVHTVLEAAE